MEHKKSNTYLCHHCGFKKLLSKKCENCNETEMVSCGPGVEKITEEIQTIFENFWKCWIDFRVVIELWDFEYILVSWGKWKLKEIDLFEINEAFAAQSIAVIQELKIDKKKVNVNGGAISLGHPIGASGARILVTLLHEMIKQNKNKGCATLCIGGGMGIALCIEKS